MLLPIYFCSIGRLLSFTCRQWTNNPHNLWAVLRAMSMWAHLCLIGTRRRPAVFMWRFVAVLFGLCLESSPVVPHGFASCVSHWRTSNTVTQQFGHWPLSQPQKSISVCTDCCLMAMKDSDVLATRWKWYISCKYWPCICIQNKHIWLCYTGHSILGKLFWYT